MLPPAFAYILVLHLGFNIRNLVPILVYTGYRQMSALLVIIVERVHGLLVLPIHPAFFTETTKKKLSRKHFLLRVCGLKKKQQLGNPFG